MSKTRTYVDANLLIAAWRGRDDVGIEAMRVLDDPERELTVSDAVWLEVMPNAVYEKKDKEREFYDLIFAQAERQPWQVDVLYDAHDFAERYGIAAMDAIHVANANAMNVDEFVSGEKPTKPMFRVKEIKMRSLRKARP
jgi:predicted nucleic acid-binding protein